MVYQIVWTNIALLDLKGLCEHISADNPSAAKKVGQNILSRIELLQDFPDIGPRYPRIGGKYREIICYRFRIFYRVNKETKQVEILRIWHGSQNEASLDLEP